MKQFSDLFVQLDQTNKTNEKIILLRDYFSSVSDEDKLWTIYFFLGKKIKRLVNVRQLVSWAIEMSGLTPWLFEESYHSVGDLAETIALILPRNKSENHESLTYWINYIRKMNDVPESERRTMIINAWENLNQNEKFVFNKLMTGEFRIGVSQGNVIKALSELTGLENNVVAHKLMGDWTPDTVTFDKLLDVKDEEEKNISRPYPFYLAYQLDKDIHELGSPDEWQAEWKWDGIRAQYIYRNGHLFIWSRGEDLATDRFPELHAIKDYLPDGTALDGEILCYMNKRPLPFYILQTRIGRKNVTLKSLKEAPVVFMIYDVMEFEGRDIRNLPLNERMKILDVLKNKLSLCPVAEFSEPVPYTSWEELAKLRERSREFFTEGFMLKRKDSGYKVGRKKGDWWKWKIDPFSFDGVLIYAQKGHGRRADLFTDYTFGVWDNGKLVTVTKAYSGLDDKEIKEVDRFVRRNTIETFGPVRTVKPELVFEIAFEGIAESTRHKCGIALRFPRIARWRHDKQIEEADTLEYLRNILKIYSGK
jgi:DNA ligase-1